MPRSQAALTHTRRPSASAAPSRSWDSANSRSAWPAWGRDGEDDIGERPPPIVPDPPVARSKSGSPVGGAAGPAAALDRREKSREGIFDTGTMKASRRHSRLLGDMVFVLRPLKFGRRTTSRDRG